MKVSIEYCAPCKFKPMAVGLAAELVESMSADVTLIPGDSGIFDVTVDEKIIFSKKDVGRYPELGEVSKILRQQAANA